MSQIGLLGQMSQIGSNIDTNVSKIGSWMLRVYD